MTTNVINVIAAMAEVVNLPFEGTLSRPRQPVVTISRDYGSGGDIIASKLAERMGVPLYDGELLRQIGERLKQDTATVQMMDEGIARGRDLWLYRLISGQDIRPDAYRDTLIKVVLTLGRLGGVIVGRGAHVILQRSCALRVRVSGSPEICARRMVHLHGGDMTAALAHAKDLDHRRGKFVWEAFQSRLSDASQFDITVNTDRMAEFDDVAEMLMSMAVAVHKGTVLSPCTVD